MTCAWKKAMASAQIMDVTARMIDCLVNSAAYVARTHAKFGVERISRLLVSASELMNETIVAYEEDERRADECVSTAAGAMMAELKCCGFNFGAARRSIVIRDPFFDVYRFEHEKDLHDRRLEYVQTFELAQTPVHLSFLQAARKEYKYGVGRLEQFYKALREDSDPFISEYLRCTEKGDKKILAMLNQKRTILNQCGLQIR